MLCNLDDWVSQSTAQKPSCNWYVNLAIPWFLGWGHPRWQKPTKQTNDSWYGDREGKKTLLTACWVLHRSTVPDAVPIVSCACLTVWGLNESMLMEGLQRGVGEGWDWTRDDWLMCCHSHLTHIWVTFESSFEVLKSLCVSQGWDTNLHSLDLGIGLERWGGGGEREQGIYLFIPKISIVWSQLHLHTAWIF